MIHVAILILVMSTKHSDPNLVTAVRYDSICNMGSLEGRERRPICRPMSPPMFHSTTQQPMIWTVWNVCNIPTIQLKCVCEQMDETHSMNVRELGWQYLSWPLLTLVDHVFISQWAIQHYIRLAELDSLERRTTPSALEARNFLKAWATRLQLGRCSPRAK